MKDSSIDIVYPEILEDLKQYCTEQKIEEECREYAEKKKRGIPTKTAGESEAMPARRELRVWRRMRPSRPLRIRP